MVRLGGRGVDRVNGGVVLGVPFALLCDNLKFFPDRYPLQYHPLVSTHGSY